MKNSTMWQFTLQFFFLSFRPELGLKSTKGSPPFTCLFAPCPFICLCQISDKPPPPPGVRSTLWGHHCLVFVSFQNESVSKKESRKYSNKQNLHMCFCCLCVYYLFSCFHNYYIQFLKVTEFFLSHFGLLRFSWYWLLRGKKGQINI